MKKVLLGLLAALALGIGAFAYFHYAPKKAPPALNPALAASYHKSDELLKEGAAPSEQAIRNLKELTQQDNDNALSHYLLAAAYGKNSQWTEADREIKTGNGADYCVGYLKEETLFEKLPNFSALRALTRNGAAAALAMSGGRGEPLLLDLREMGTRLASMEPKLIINVLVGVALHAIADRNLAKFYTSAGKTKEAEAAQTRFDTERAWTQSAQFKEDAGMNQDAADDPLFKKYHLTQKEFMAAMQSKNPSAAKKQNLKDLNAALLLRERTRTEKLLKSLPE